MEAIHRMPVAADNQCLPVSIRSWIPVCGALGRGGMGDDIGD